MSDIKIIESLKCILGERTSQLLRLDYEIKKQRGLILLNPPVYQNGTFEIGIVYYSNRPLFPFKLTPDQLTRHFLILGETGSGKTNLCYYLLLQFINKIPFLVFDFKRDYRHLIRKSKDLLILRWEDLRFNPLIPPRNTKLLEWLQVFCDVFAQDTSLLLGSKSFLLEQLNTLFHHVKNPTLVDFNNLLETIKYPPFRRQASYLDVCRNRIKALIIQIGNIVNCNKTIEDFLNKNVIIELDGLSRETQDFLINIILMWIFHYRISENQRGKLKHITVFDEAKRVFDYNKEKRYIEGIPTIDILTSRIREFGEALIVADQEPSKLTDSIKANTYCKIAFRLGNGKDIDDISKCISLEEREYLLSLKIGEAIVKTSDIAKPFLIKVPFVDISKDVSDIEVRRTIKGYSGDSEAKQPLEEKREEILPILSTDKLRAESEVLLIDVFKNPLSSVTERYRRLNFSGYLGNACKRELVERGFVKEVKIPTGKGMVKLLDTAHKGADRLRGLGHVVRKSNRKGSLEHLYWMKIVAEDYRGKGYKVREEVPIGGGKSVDLVAEKDGKRIAIEIETGKSDAEGNLKKDSEAGFDEVVVVETRKGKRVIYS